MKRKLSTSPGVEEELLCCNICFEKFAEAGDKSPRMLTSCGHTYCLKCIEDVCRGQNQLECPSCRVVTKFGRGNGPDSLAINNHVVRLLEMADLDSRPTARSRDEILATACTGHGAEDAIAFAMCMNCDNDAPSSAKWGCVECSVVLCDGCKTTAHPNVLWLRNHHVLSIEDFRQHRSCMCTKHSNEEITIVCNDCDVLVCSIGSQISHSSHATSSLVDGLTRQRGKLEQSLQAAQKLVDSVQPKIAAVNQRVSDNREITTRLHEKVETDRARLVETINSRAAVAHEEIETRAGASLRRLESEKKAMGDWLTRAGSCMEASSRALVADCAVPLFSEYQALQTTLTTLIEERSAERAGGDVREVGSATIGGCIGGGATTTGPEAGAARDAQLSISSRASNQMSRLADTLFAVEEVAEPAARVHPLTRREGGIIGSASNLSGPGGLAVRSASPGSGVPSLLFMCDWGKQQVQVLNANSGAYIRAIGTGIEGVAAGQLICPVAVVLCLLPSGESLLYVSEWANNRVQVFDADSGVHVRMLGEGELDGPLGLALHQPPAASQLPTLLFVTSHKQNAVKVFDADTGSLVRTIGPGSDDAGVVISNLDRPYRIALRTVVRDLSFQTLLYVSDIKQRVQVFDADTGVLMRTIGVGVMGAGPGQLHDPRGLALQGSGAPCLLYVAELANNRIQVFDADTGAHVHMIGAGRGSAVGQLNRPICMTLHPGPDGSTLLFVSESEDGNKRVQVFVV